MSSTYCADQVRLHDRDRYLTALFAPDERRDSLLALYAFNLEVSRVRETVSERLIGEMRLQWWRDAIEAIYDDARLPAHPVAEALAVAIGQNGLARASFERLIDARGRDLDDAPPSDFPALVDYAADTSAMLSRLALHALGGATAEAEEAAGNVGIAYALAGLLRAVPFHARQKRLYLPRDMSEAAGLDIGGLFELKGSAALSGIARHIAREARSYLARARESAVPRGSLAALLPASVAEASLDRLERSGFDPFAVSPHRGGAGLLLKLAWRARLGRF